MSRKSNPSMEAAGPAVGLRTRLQAVALLCVLAIAATFLMNATLGTAQANAVRAPGSEHEYHG